MTKTIQIFIALVWLMNGLVCKILDSVPRHREIVGEILGERYASELTITIGVFEVLLAGWILSNIKPKSCAVFQIVVVLTMNCIEFVTVPELLLFGKINLVFAFLFSMLIYANAFILAKTK